MNFPLQLDLYEFCSEEYKKELQGPREAQQQVAFPSILSKLVVNTN